MHVTKDGKLFERARINSGGDMTLLNDKGVPVILLSTSLGGTVAVQKDLIAGGSLTVTGTQARHTATTRILGYFSGALPDSNETCCMLNHQRRLTLPRPTAAPTATQLRS